MSFCMRGVSISAWTAFSISMDDPELDDPPDELEPPDDEPPEDEPPDEDPPDDEPPDDPWLDPPDPPLDPPEDLLDAVEPCSGDGDPILTLHPLRISAPVSKIATRCHLCCISAPPTYLSGGSIPATGDRYQANSFLDSIDHLTNILSIIALRKIDTPDPRISPAPRIIEGLS